MVTPLLSFFSPHCLVWEHCWVKKAQPSLLLLSLLPLPTPLSSYSPPSLHKLPVVTGYPAPVIAILTPTSGNIGNSANCSVSPFHFVRRVRYTIPSCNSDITYTCTRIAGSNFWPTVGQKSHTKSWNLRPSDEQFQTISGFVAGGNVSPKNKLFLHIPNPKHALQKGNISKFKSSTEHP